MSTTTATPTTTPDTTPIAIADRCDRCGSRAYVRATLPAGTTLLFCGHHANEHRAALLVAGAALHDETEKLTVARESGF